MAPRAGQQLQSSVGARPGVPAWPDGWPARSTAGSPSPGRRAALGLATLAAVDRARVGGPYAGPAAGTTLCLGVRTCRVGRHYRGLSSNGKRACFLGTRPISQHMTPDQCWFVHGLLFVLAFAALALIWLVIVSWLYIRKSFQLFWSSLDQARC